MTSEVVVDAVTGPDRLRRSADVRRALHRGRSRSGALLTVHVLPRPVLAGTRPGHADRAEDADPAGPGPRLTVVASRRVGGAVRRNRAKRLLRAAARGRRWRDGIDVVLVARAACAASDVHAVGAELERLAVRLDALEGAG